MNRRINEWEGEAVPNPDFIIFRFMALMHARKRVETFHEPYPQPTRFMVPIHVRFSEKPPLHEPVFVFARFMVGEHGRKAGGSLHEPLAGEHFCGRDGHTSDCARPRAQRRLSTHSDPWFKILIHS